MVMKQGKTIVEICCGSYHDAMEAYRGGAKRIELNCALALGGLTPTSASLRLVKEHAPDLKVIAMLRPRGGGFCYSNEDFAVMMEECKDLLKNGADGFAFGCLKADATLDMEKNKYLIDTMKEAGKEAVLHRAFDCSTDPFGTMGQVMELGFDRVLTSGLQAKAEEGLELLATLQKKFGQRIELLAASGVNVRNVETIIQKTGITQVHSSCKDWVFDPTTVQGAVSYSFATGECEKMYDVVSKQLVKELIGRVATIKV